MASWFSSPATPGSTARAISLPTSPRRRRRQAFANLKSALAAARAKPADLVKLNYYVVGINHDKLSALREARDTLLDKQHPPASTLAGVESLFRPDVQVEIDAEAVVP